LHLAYFLATKLEAFFSRGIKDPRLSHDLEDVVIILSHVEKEKILELADPDLEKFLKQTFKDFLNNDVILEAMSAHNPYPEIPNLGKKIPEGLRL
jgi:hypothetical protein